jgi:Ca-activated chloride channel family protein
VTPALALLDGVLLRDPAFLLAAALLPLAWLLRARRGEPSAPLATAGVALAGGSAPLPRTWRSALRHAPRVLEAAAVLLLAFALARPAKTVLEPVPGEGVDVMLVLDASSSMTAADLAQGRTRLEVAREAAARFAERRVADRVGLVVFARYPELRCPPTLDHAALGAILRETAPVPADTPEDATGIGAAVARGAQVLAGGAARSRVLVLLTDGEENVATVGAPGEIAPAHAAQLCERLGVRVSAIVVGGAAGTAPSPPGGGEVERLARRTGGSFHEARDAGALEAVYARIDAMERSPVAASVARLEDRHLGFLLAGVAVLLLARFLGAGPLRVSP